MNSGCCMFYGRVGRDLFGVCCVCELRNEDTCQYSLSGLIECCLDDIIILCIHGISSERINNILPFYFLKVHPEGKYVVDIDKNIDITKIIPSARVALRNDSYMLHLILPSKVDPLVNLMKVEKVPDSTYDMIGGLDQQIKEIKEVS